MGSKNFTNCPVLSMAAASSDCSRTTSLWKNKHSIEVQLLQHCSQVTIYTTMVHAEFGSNLPL